MGGHQPGPPKNTRPETLKRADGAPAPQGPAPPNSSDARRPTATAPLGAASWRAAREPPNGVSCSSAPAAAPPRPPPGPNWSRHCFFAPLEAALQPRSASTKLNPGGTFRVAKNETGFVFRASAARERDSATDAGQQTQAGRAFPRCRLAAKVSPQKHAFGDSPRSLPSLWPWLSFLPSVFVRVRPFAQGEVLSCPYAAR